MRTTTLRIVDRLYLAALGIQVELRLGHHRRRTQRFRDRRRIQVNAFDMNLIAELDVPIGWRVARPTAERPGWRREDTETRTSGLPLLAHVPMSVHHEGNAKPIKELRNLGRIIQTHAHLRRSTSPHAPGERNDVMMQPDNAMPRFTPLRRLRESLEVAGLGQADATVVPIEARLSFRARVEADEHHPGVRKVPMPHAACDRRQVNLRQERVPGRAL